MIRKTILALAAVAALVAATALIVNSTGLIAASAGSYGYGNKFGMTSGSVKNCYEFRDECNLIVW